MLKKDILKIYDYLFPKDSARRAHFYIRYLWKIFPDPIDKYLIEFSKTHKNIKFIQIGANDGISFDPVYKYVQEYNWSGILIEPLKPYFEELKKNYDKFKNRQLHFENCAISDKAGMDTMYFIANLSGKEKDYEILKAIGSFDKKHLLKYIENRKNLEVKAVEITVNTLDDIIEKYHYHDFNILVIDTEGHDFKIIRSLDFEKVHPDVIIYEHIHLNEGDKNMCSGLLNSKRYRLVEDGINTIAYH